jgi:parallel beta-helix repeat protein
MKINGTLSARGTSTDKIFFISNGNSLGFQLSVAKDGILIFSSGSNNWNDQAQSGNIIENAILNSTQGIPTININDNSSPKINKCTISNMGGQRAIFIGAGGSPIISNSTIKDSFCGITFSGNSQGVISDNVISSCSDGIEVYSGSPLIERNLIINNTGNEINGGGGIRIDNIGTTPIIRNNTITQNSVGINLIRSPQPIITNNNFISNQKYHIYLYSGSGETTTNDINATGNWWGTTNIQTINQTMRDNKNDFNLGTVKFAPFLTSPNEPPVISKQYVTDYLENQGFDVTFVYFGSNSTLAHGSEDCAVVIMKTNEHVKNFQFTPIQEQQFKEGNNSLKLAYPNAEVFFTGLFEDLDNNGMPDNTTSGGTGYYDMSGSGYGGRAQASFIADFYSNANDYVGTYGAPQVPSSLPIPSYLVTITHVGQGAVFPSDGVHSTISQLILTASPAANNNFMCWLQNGILLSEKNPYSYTITANNNIITAVFYPQNAPASVINLVNVTVTSGGTGYTTPAILLEGGGGSGATATARVSNGVITGIVLTSLGGNYTSPPTVIIKDPSPRAKGATAAVFWSTP